MNLKWDTNVDEISSVYEQLLPRFKTVARKAGLIKDDEDTTAVNSNIPNLGGQPGSKDGKMVEPPWKQQQQPAFNTSNINGNSPMYNAMNNISG